MFLSGLFGACWASFIVANTQRVIHLQSLINPRFSYCDHCHHRLRWWQLLPIVGWLIQKGKCYDCHFRINPQSFYCEIGSFILWISIFNKTFDTTCGLLLLSTTLLICTTTDYFEQWIWPPALLGLSGLGLLYPQRWSWSRLVAWIITLGILLGLYSLIKNGLGEGDLELILIMEAVSDWYFTAWVVLVASLIGIPLTLRFKKIPFVPCLAIGIVIILPLMT